MDRITEFLDRIKDALAEASDADLKAWEDEGLALFDECRDGTAEDVPEDKRVDAARQVAAAVKSIQTAAAERIDAAVALAEELASIELERPEPTPETPEGVEDADQTPDAQAASEAEGAPTAETPPEGGEPAPAEPAPAAEPEPVVAAAPRPDLSRFAPAIPQATIVEPTPVVVGEIDMLAAGGKRVTSYDEADALIASTLRDVHARPGRVMKETVLRERYDWPDSQQIHASETVGEMTGKAKALVASALDPATWVDDHGEMQPFTAAGQFCAPAEPFYGQPTVGDLGRPVRDALPGMGLERGSIEVAAAPVLTDILVDQSGGAIDTLDPSTTTGTKTIQEIVTCPSTVTTYLEATSIRLRFDNWNAMTWQERQQAWVRLTRVAADRHRERRLLAKIDALSTGPVTESFVVGAYRDVLVHLGRLVAAERARQRMRPDARFRVIVDARLIDAMQADIAMQLPGDGPETMRRAEAEIRADLSERGINLSLSWDRWIPAAQGAGAMVWWPPTWRFNVFPEGTFMFGGGQELNLGVIRDSDEVAGNTFQTFEEAFETVFRVGSWPAYTVDLNLCVNGVTAAATDTSDECQGS